MRFSVTIFETSFYRERVNWRPLTSVTEGVSLSGLDLIKVGGPQRVGSGAWIADLG